MIHYELLLLYAIGCTPKDAIKLGFSRGASYRFYRIYRVAGKRLSTRLIDRNSDSPRRTNKTTNQGEGRKKIGRPRREKGPAYIRNPETGEYDKVML